MKRTLVTLFAAAAFTMALSEVSIADININIGISPPPAPASPPPPKLVLAAPPVVILLPGTSIYFVPDIAEDVVFYRGYWYQRNNGRWFKGNDYNGPWALISKPPAALVELPHGFRHVPPGHERIPYGQLKKNWKKWEEERAAHEYREEHRAKFKHKHRD